MYDHRLLISEQHQATYRYAFGYSLLEVLVAVSITAVLVFVLSAVSQDILRNIQRQKLFSNRDQVAILLQQNSGDPRALKVSLHKPENAQFHNCVCGGGCTSMQTAPLTLYDLAGSVQSPLYYTDSGSPCDPTQANCLIQVTTDFVAECMPTLPNANPNPPATCATPAEFIQVIYTIQQNPSTLAQGTLLKKVRGGVFTAVAALAPAGSGVCP